MAIETKSNKSSRGGKREGAGRPKGSLDKGNAMIREMVVAALDKVGGVDYLVRQAEAKPAAFLTLLGKVMPIQIEGAGGGAVPMKLTIEYVRPNQTS